MLAVLLLAGGLRSGAPALNTLAFSCRALVICCVELNERGGAVDGLASVVCGPPGEGLLGVHSRSGLRTLPSA